MFRGSDSKVRQPPEINPDIVTWRDTVRFGEFYISNGPGTTVPPKSEVGTVFHSDAIKGSQEERFILTLCAN